MIVLIGGRAWNERHETRPSEHGPHEGIIKFSPVMVHHVRRCAQELAQTARSGYAFAVLVRLPIVSVSEQWLSEGFETLMAQKTSCWHDIWSQEARFSLATSSIVQTPVSMSGILRHKLHFMPPIRLGTGNVALPQC